MLRGADGVLVLAIVLEVQRDKDPDKEYSWLVYVTVVRAKKRCPTVVLVVAPDADVATWARRARRGPRAARGAGAAVRAIVAVRNAARRRVPRGSRPTSILAVDSPVE
ncbi:MAG TPA: hypothetical protein VE093_23560 [Polyangiaceae bacterium]|jgi:hypothetical protein|nr:hypothetical protein [Polyangiaceae bacterium]